MKRLDYSESKKDIFYEIIYPLLAREFLFGNDLQTFAAFVNEHFILNREQWEYIREHWDVKEDVKEKLLTKN